MLGSWLLWFWGLDPFGFEYTCVLSSLHSIDRCSVSGSHHLAEVPKPQRLWGIHPNSQHGPDFMQMSAAWGPWDSERFSWFGYHSKYLILQNLNGLISKWPAYASVWWVHCRSIGMPMYPISLGRHWTNESMARMPKSYELKLREAEERRRKPKQQEAFWRVWSWESKQSKGACQGWLAILGILHWGIPKIILVPRKLQECSGIHKKPSESTGIHRSWQTLHWNRHGLAKGSIEGVEGSMPNDQNMFWKKEWRFKRNIYWNILTL